MTSRIAAKKAERNDPTLKTDKIFAIRSIDKQLKDFWGYAKSSKGGIADVEDYINEDLVDSSIHRSLLEMIPDMLTSSVFSVPSSVWSGGLRISTRQTMTR